MEQVPQKKMNYERALALATTSPEEWKEMQILALESDLVEMAIKRQQGKEFLDKLRKLGKYSVEKLIDLGGDMLADYDLEKRSLEVFCRRNNIELIP